jgi:hypothetical protein
MSPGRGGEICTCKWRPSQETGDSKAEASDTPVEVAEFIVEASAPNWKPLNMQVVAADLNGDAG